VKPALAAACFAWCVACAPRPPLPVIGEVPQFRLTAQDGKVFDSSVLDGSVWVADFIYTTCNGPCPMMSAQMKKVQAQTAPEVKLISFTVDPERDTPPVLSEYARRFKADPARWTFLTGEPAALSALGRDAFHLNSVDGSLSHSSRFVLVDRRRRIRGYYATSEQGFLSKLLRDIETLQNEKL
jgi:protein SCO1